MELLVIFGELGAVAFAKGRMSRTSSGASELLGAAHSQR